MLIKVHRSYRSVVAFCDEELIGKKIEEGRRQLDIRENFYKGDVITEEKAIPMLQILARDDATFNIVGKKAVDTAIKAGIISQDSIAKVNDIPFALTLL